MGIFGCSARTEGVSALEDNFAGPDAGRALFRPGQPHTDGKMSGGSAAGEAPDEYGGPGRMARVGIPTDGHRPGVPFGATRWPPALRSGLIRSTLRVADIASGVRFAIATVAHEEARDRMTEPAGTFKFLPGDMAGVNVTIRRVSAEGLGLGALAIAAA